MGRRRFLTKIMAGNSKEKAKAQRQAVNSICQVIEHCLTYFRCLIFLCLWLICTCFQGSAADIIKVAMIRVYSVITNRTGEVDSTDEVTRNFSEIGGKCHLILQVFYDADMIMVFLDFFLSVWLLNMDNISTFLFFLGRCMMSWYWKLIHVWYNRLEGCYRYVWRKRLHSWVWLTWTLMVGLCSVLNNQAKTELLFVLVLVPLRAKIKVGKTWGSLEPFYPEPCWYNVVTWKSVLHGMQFKGQDEWFCKKAEQVPTCPTEASGLTLLCLQNLSVSEINFSKSPTYFLVSRKFTSCTTNLMEPAF